MTREQYLEKLADNSISWGEKLMLFSVIVGFVHLSDKLNTNDPLAFIITVSLMLFGFYFRHSGLNLLKDLVDD